MRRFKRLIRRLLSEWRNRKRKAEVTIKISKVIGEPVTLSPSGSRGADSIFLVKKRSGKKVGVLRLVNPFRKQKTTIENAPYIVLDGYGRIARELKSYNFGASQELTPKVLWSDEDAILCEYFAGKSALELYQEGILSDVQLIDVGWRVLKSLHDVGVTHMDASIQNILISNDLKTVKLVDFEFDAIASLSFEHQCCYDFLRYLESSLKFIESSSREALVSYITETEVFVPLSLDASLIEKLKPALQRLSADSTLWAVIQRKLGGNS